MPRCRHLSANGAFRVRSETCQLLKLTRPWEASENRIGNILARKFCPLAMFGPLLRTTLNRNMGFLECPPLMRSKPRSSADGNHSRSRERASNSSASRDRQIQIAYPQILAFKLWPNKYRGTSNTTGGQHFGQLHLQPRVITALTIDEFANQLELQRMRANLVGAGSGLSTVIWPDQEVFEHKSRRFHVALPFSTNTGKGTDHARVLT